MTHVVIDASAVGPILFDDETDRIAALDDVLPTAHLLVPANWSIEVVNMILMAERRKRIGGVDRTRLLAAAALLDAEQDRESFGAAWKDIAQLAVRHGLTAYDAAYLELAIRASCPLATLDVDLATAARTESVEVLTSS